MKREIEFVVAPVFEPFLTPSRYKGAKGGRAAGRSHMFADLLVRECLTHPGTRAVCAREVQKSLEESARLLVIDKIRAHGLDDLFEVRHDRIETPGGGKIIFRGIQDYSAETIKSLEGFRICWFEEAQRCSAQSLEKLRPTIRLPGSEIWFSWNPRSAKDPVDAFLCGQTPPDNAIVVHSNYDQNPWFDETELEADRQFDYEHNRERYAHIWLGDYEPMVANALWTRQILHENRVAEAPELARILVAVDHAVSDTERSDEHGIVVGGVAEDMRQGYIIEDGSLRGSPRQWANRAIALCDKYEADGIVIERNQGGDLVRETLRSVRSGIPIIEVTATRGKHVRAEPVASLYEAGMVRHVGTFPELEDQMCNMTSAGYAVPGKSPDRLEAAVWLLTQLFERIIPKRRNVEAKKHRVVLPENATGWMAA